MDKTEKIASIILSILSIVIIVDTILAQFFEKGTQQKSLAIAYCVAFVLLSIKFENILKKKYVIIPMYILVGQMIYSLILNFK